MDFSNRNAQPQTTAPGAQSSAAGNPGSGGKKSKRNRGEMWRIGNVVLAAVIVLLIGAVILLIAAGGNNTKAEAKLVDSNKLQAVFLNTGQVYFGNIKTLNNKYFVVTNIYYLQTSGSNASGASDAKANTSVSLVKLGCELHEPYDQMVINRDQVTFWENLQDNGQVAKAVQTFQKQNPSGQKCADQSSSASTNSSNSAQSAGSSSTPVKP
jgi:hypothetical protein